MLTPRLSRLAGFDSGVSLVRKYQPFRPMTERRSRAYRQRTITNQSNTDSTKEVGETVSLTPAETRVLALLPTYRTLAAIGTELGVGRPTVKTRVENIYKKLGATTRGEAVKIAGSVGLLPPSVTDGQPPSFTFR